MKNKYSVKLSLLLPIMLILLSTFGCDKDSKDNADTDSFNGRMEREAYLGKTKSKLYVEGYDGLPSVDGKGSFSIDKIKSDSSTLTFVVELPSEEGFSFAIPGQQNSLSWQGSSNNGQISIKANGEIDGVITADGKEITWDGRLFDDRLMLDIRVKYLEAEGEIPKESIFSTNLDLYRSGSDLANSNGSSCTTIVWESRPVFNIYSGGVDLIQVPVCR